MSEKVVSDLLQKKAEMRKRLIELRIEKNHLNSRLGGVDFETERLEKAIVSLDFLEDAEWGLNYLRSSEQKVRE